MEEKEKRGQKRREKRAGEEPKRGEEDRLWGVVNPKSGERDGLVG